MAPNLPAEYTGYERLCHDTIIRGLKASPGGYARPGGYIWTPIVELIIKDSHGNNLFAKENPNNVRDNNFYFTLNGVDYHIGDRLGGNGYPIGFTYRGSSFFGTVYDVNAICFSRIDNDKIMTLHWPEKNFSAELRLYERWRYNVAIPEWCSLKAHSDVCDIHSYGVFTNGIGNTDVVLILEDDGTVTIE